MADHEGVLHRQVVKEIKKLVDIGGISVRDAYPGQRSSGRRGIVKLREGLGARSRATRFDHHTIFQLQERLDGEHGAEQRLRTGEPATLDEVIERVNSSHDVCFGDVVAGQSHDVIERRSGGG